MLLLHPAPPDLVDRRLLAHPLEQQVRATDLVDSLQLLSRKQLSLLVHLHHHLPMPRISSKPEAAIGL